MARFDTTGIDFNLISGVKYAVGNGVAEIAETQTTYYLRAYDSGTAGYVYWSNTGTEPDLSPDTTDTTPNYSGSLSLKTIVDSVIL
jgi:hypothetical protein